MASDKQDPGVGSEARRADDAFELLVDDADVSADTSAHMPAPPHIIVLFGATPAANFTIAGDTSITAVSPVAPAGAVDVTVTSPGGTDVTAATDQLTLVVAPTMTGLSPNSGPLATTPQITITRTSFTGAFAVAFGDQRAGFTVDSDSTITATVPQGEAVDTVRVTVSTVGGTSSGSSATGGVTPTLKASGKRPKGVTFVDNGNRTGTLSGVPTATKSKPAAGTYTLKVTASYSYGMVKHIATQTLVLTVA